MTRHIMAPTRAGLRHQSRGPAFFVALFDRGRSAARPVSPLYW